jgi:hypothetical protein
MQNKASHIGFIGGSGRSGTTILKRLFKQHPDVASVPECRIMIDPGGLVDFYRSVTGNWSPFLYDQRLRQLEEVLRSADRTTRVSEYGSAALRKAGLRSWPINMLPKDYGIALGYYDPDYSDRVAQLIDSLAAYSFKGQHTGQGFGERARIRFGDPVSLSQLPEQLGNFYSEMTASIVREQNTGFFMDDNTWNILYMDAIRELIPEAQLVHIVRDPRDVVASFTTQTWAPSDPETAAHFYRSIMERWQIVRERLPESSYHLIRLEDLVSDPETTLRDLCSFWGLSWSDRMLKLPLNKAHRGRWKSDIPTDQHETIESILEPFITAFNYG